MSESLKSEWMGMPTECFWTLSFGELKVGDRFICMPCPGDNHGHGGFRGKHNLFVKTSLHITQTESGLTYAGSQPQGRAVNIARGISSDFPYAMLVIQVE